MCEGKAVAEDVAHVWERGGLPHRQADSRIVIAVLDRAIRIKENKTKNLFQLFDVSCCLHDDKEECECKSECQVPYNKKKVFESSGRPKDDETDN